MSLALVCAVIGAVAAIVTITEAGRRLLHRKSSRQPPALIAVGHALDYGPRVIDLNHPDAPQIKRYVLVLTILNGDETQFLKRLCLENPLSGHGVDVSRYLDMEPGGSTPRELKPREPIVAEVAAFEMSFDTGAGFEAVAYLSVGRVSSGVEYLNADLERERQEHNLTVG
jgi:hypothetical protein